VNHHLPLTETVLIVCCTLCAIVLAAAVVVAVGQLALGRRKHVWTREDKRILRGERGLVP
jgi:hypothetical protein